MNPSWPKRIVCGHVWVTLRNGRQTAPLRRQNRTGVFGQRTEAGRKCSVLALYARVSTNDQQTLPMQSRAMAQVREHQPDIALRPFQRLAGILLLTCPGPLQQPDVASCLGLSEYDALWADPDLVVGYYRATLILPHWIYSERLAIWSAYPPGAFAPKSGACRHGRTGRKSFCRRKRSAASRLSHHR